MPLFDKIQRASFDGLAFPVKSVRIKGKFRYHTHEYLRTPGGLNEKMARGLYSIDMGAVFDGNVEGLGFDAAGPLWPNVLNVLRQKYEQGITSTLVVPTIGSFQAFMPDWDQEMLATHRSGETATLSFLEDQSEQFLVDTLVESDIASMKSASLKLDKLSGGFSPKPTIFDAIQEAANSVLGLKDQADLFGARVEAQVLALVSIINEADQQLEELQNPESFPVIDALHQLAVSAIDLSRSFGEKGGEARRYIVPHQMSVTDVSKAIYGDAQHAAELMRNNLFEDPFEIPAGTVVIYYTEPSLVAA